MFYQYLPEGCEWAFGLAWGHAVSADLITWRHLPPALLPTPGFLDADGCFSGCATLDEEGVPVILYTGVRLRSNPDAGPLPPRECDLGLPFVESQLTAEPADPSDPELKRWHKHAAPFLPLPPPDANLTGWRDPFVVERPSAGNGGEWVVLIGAGVKGLGGTAAVYRAARLRDPGTWRFDGWLCEGDGATGTVWECPLVARLRPLPPPAAGGGGEAGAPAADGRTTQQREQHAGGGVLARARPAHAQAPSGTHSPGPGRRRSGCLDVPGVVGGVGRVGGGGGGGSGGGGGGDGGFSFSGEDGGAFPQSDSGSLFGVSSQLDLASTAARRSLQQQQQQQQQQEREQDEAASGTSRRRATPPLGGVGAGGDGASTATRLTAMPPLPSFAFPPQQQLQQQQEAGATAGGAGGAAAHENGSAAAAREAGGGGGGGPTHFYSVSPDAATNPTIYWIGSYRGGRFDLPRAIGPFRLDLGDVLYAPNLLEDGGVSGRGPADGPDAPAPPQGAPVPPPPHPPANGGGGEPHARGGHDRHRCIHPAAPRPPSSASASPFPFSPAAAATGGRTLLWGWVQERRGVGTWDYAGCLSTPRVLWLHGDRLWQEPAPEVRALRRLGACWRAAEVPLSPGRPVALPARGGGGGGGGGGGLGSSGGGVSGAHLDLELTFRPGTARTVGVMFRSWNASDAGGAAVLFTWGGGGAAADDADDADGPVGGPGPSAAYSAPDAAATAHPRGLASALEVAFEALDPATMGYSLLAPGARRTGGRVHVGPRDRARLRILLDDSVLEVFTGSGEVLTTRVYRGTAPAVAQLQQQQQEQQQQQMQQQQQLGDAGIEFFALDGDATLELAEAHEVATIWQRADEKAAVPASPPFASASLARASSLGAAAPGSPLAASPFAAAAAAAAAASPLLVAASLAKSAAAAASPASRQTSLRLVADGSAAAAAAAAPAAAAAASLQRLFSGAALLGGDDGGGGGFDSANVSGGFGVPGDDDAAAEGVPEEEMTADIFVLG